MDFYKNYYAILGVGPDSTDKEIKKSYYKLSFEHHPDKGGDSNIFSVITEAYDILMDPSKRSEWDKRSKFGKYYTIDQELLDYEFLNRTNTYDADKFEKFKKNDLLNIVVFVDEDFNGTVEYERWVICKKCKGSGKDLSSKIEIRDKSGNIIKTFDGDEGCEFCEGTGKDWKDGVCSFCAGQGKVGSKDCVGCDGEKRILGKQKLKGIVFPKEEKSHKIESMGHASKESQGRSGYLVLVRKDYESNSGTSPGVEDTSS